MARYSLYLGDCLEWTERRAADSIDAIVTDPPYGLKEYSAEEKTKLRNGHGGRIPNREADGHRKVADHKGGALLACSRPGENAGARSDPLRRKASGRPDGQELFTFLKTQDSSRRDTGLLSQVHDRARGARRERQGRSEPSKAWGRGVPAERLVFETPQRDGRGAEIISHQRAEACIMKVLDRFL